MPSSNPFTWTPTRQAGQRMQRRERVRAYLAYERAQRTEAALGAEAYVALPPPALHARVTQWLARLRRLGGMRPLCGLLGVCLAIGGLGSSGYVHGKAMMAQWLLQRAWKQGEASGAAVRPWPWADTWPVARLYVPRLQVDQIVLAGAGGRSLAFAPSLSLAGALPGQAGNAVISAHRDTHFSFLRQLRVGDRLWVTTAQGRYAYQIDSLRVADSRHERIAIGGALARLTLVTCYPFDAVVPNGPLRFVVSAHLVAQAGTAA